MHQKNTVTELLLSLFVPFYIFYWYAETAKVLRQRGATHVPSIKPVLWVTISFVAAIVLSSLPFLLIPLVVLAGASGDGAAIGIGIGSVLVLTLLFGLVQFGLAIAAMVLYVLYAIGFSKAVNQVMLDMDESTITLLCIFIAPVAVYMIQEKINQTT